MTTYDCVDSTALSGQCQSVPPVCVMTATSSAGTSPAPSHHVGLDKSDTGCQDSAALGVFLWDVSLPGLSFLCIDYKKKEL